MRILLISAMFPPVQTGTSFYTKNLALNFHKQGHQVTVITINVSQTKDKYPFKVKRISAFRIPIKNYFKHFTISSIFPKNYQLISNLCQKNKFEAIILVNQYLDIAFPAIYAAKKNKIPLYISIGTQLQSLNPFRNRLLNFADKLICGNFIYPNVTKIICWDNEIRRYIDDIHNKKFSDKIAVVPFGISDGINITVNHSYKLHNQILGVGSIIDHRNFLFNVKVFKRIIKQKPNIKLKIIGHIYNDQVINLVRKLGLRKNVIFTGELHHKEIVKELKRSDLHWMMLNAKYKGLGTANLEAMTFGIPVISNVPNNIFDKHKLTDLYNYIYTDETSVNSSANKILSVLNNNKLRKKIGSNGKKFSNNFLTWDIIIPQYIKLFNKRD